MNAREICNMWNEHGEAMKWEIRNDLVRALEAAAEAIKYYNEPDNIEASREGEILEISRYKNGKLRKIGFGEKLQQWLDKYWQEEK